MVKKLETVHALALTKRNFSNLKMIQNLFRRVGSNSQRQLEQLVVTDEKGTESVMNGARSVHNCYMWSSVRVRLLSPLVSEKSIGDAGKDILEGDSVDLSHVDDIVTGGVKIPSTKDLGDNVDRSVKDTMDGLKDGTPSGGDVLEPTVSNTDTSVDGLNVDIPSATNTVKETTEPVNEFVIPKVTNTSSKEEREAKRARKAERSAKREVEKAADADVHEEAEDHISEEEGGNEYEEAQKSDEEDIAVVITKKRKATSKPRLNENRTRVGNKRVLKNVAAVSTTNVALNFEEEQANWRLVANRRVSAEKMLSEVTKKNANIIGILEGAGVMPTIEAVGPYFPKLVTFRNFTFDFSPYIINGYFGRAKGGEMGYNLKLTKIFKVLTGGAIDIWLDKGLPSSKLSAKVLYMIGTGALFNSGQFIFVQTVQHGQSHAMLKPIAYPSMLCSILQDRKEDILTAADEEGPFPGLITISPKLMQDTHVADIPLALIDAGGASGSSTDGTTQLLRDEILHLDGPIQTSLARKSVLEARLRSLTGDVDPAVDPSVADSGADAPQT
ncbi:hypothetical protein LIER_30248 [Lithospermum erythrorhizon]|uniref:Uncharacterized protein n=1 Tax=Lithospermum erythrorhizon TaxID=34254 RepID=A0AAV3RNQ2_LITER